MATAADCISALQAALATPPNFAGQISATQGYAFQAFVFNAVGDYLCQSPRWQWQHPAGLATFARSAGGTVQNAVSALSHCKHVTGRLLLQELTVIGRSGAPHNLDCALVNPLGPASAWPGGLRPPFRTLATLECKNLGNSVSMNIAREVVGLATDVTGTWWPRRERVGLVAAHEITDNATRMIEGYGNWTIPRAGPLEASHWIDWIGRRLRLC